MADDVIMECVMCESKNVTESNETQKFEVAEEDEEGDPHYAILEVVGPVLTCGDCGEQWIDWRSEKIRDREFYKHMEKFGIIYPDSYHTIYPK